MLGCVWLFAIPWTVALQAPLAMGFPRQEYWSGLPFLPPGDLPDPGIKSRSPTLQADSLPCELSGKPLHTCYLWLLIVLPFTLKNHSSLDDTFNELNSHPMNQLFLMSLPYWSNVGPHCFPPVYNLAPTYISRLYSCHTSKWRIGSSYLSYLQFLECIL